MVFLKKDFEKFKVEFEKACTDNKALREKAEKEKGMGWFWFVMSFLVLAEKKPEAVEEKKVDK